MAIRLNSKAMVDIRLGTRAVTQVLYGTKQVWPDGPGGLPNLAVIRRVPIEVAAGVSGFPLNAARVDVDVAVTTAQNFPADAGAAVVEVAYGFPTYAMLPEAPVEVAVVEGSGGPPVNVPEALVEVLQTRDTFAEVGTSPVEVAAVVPIPPAASGALVEVATRIPSPPGGMMHQAGVEVAAVVPIPPGGLLQQAGVEAAIFGANAGAAGRSGVEVGIIGSKSGTAGQSGIEVLVTWQ